MGAIGDKEVAVNLYTCVTQLTHFFEERHGIQHHAVADHGTASVTQHATGHKLQDELFALDDDGMAGVVAAGISRHDGKMVGENVYDLAFAFVAPLGADNHRCLASLHSIAHSSPVGGFHRNLDFPEIRTGKFQVLPVDFNKTKGWEPERGMGRIR
jgi:hypothetical protein